MLEDPWILGFLGKIALDGDARSCLRFVIINVAEAEAEESEIKLPTGAGAVILSSGSGSLLFLSKT
jgi:hypothetical protein